MSKSYHPLLSRLKINGFPHTSQSQLQRRGPRVIHCWRFFMASMTLGTPGTKGTSHYHTQRCDIRCLSQLSRRALLCRCMQLCFFACATCGPHTAQSCSSAANQAEEKADILAWNTLLIGMALDPKKTFEDVNVFTVDSNLFFTQGLDSPKSSPLTASYRNTTGYCVFAWICCVNKKWTNLAQWHSNRGLF
jgi:hypothetical protein